MRVEQRAETVDEDDGPQAGLRACVRTAMPPRPLDGAEEEAQRCIQDRRIVLQVRQSRNDVLGEMRGGLDHAPGGAGWTDATTFA